MEPPPTQKKYRELPRRMEDGKIQDVNLNVDHNKQILKSVPSTRFVIVHI